MSYKELRKLAKNLGLKFSKTPSRDALEKAVFETEAQKAAIKAEADEFNNPEKLRHNASVFRQRAESIARLAQEAEERAQAIDTARAEEKATTGILLQSLTRFRVAMTGLTKLGLPVDWIMPETAVNDLIIRLTPPRRIYVFWAEGSRSIGKGYVVAESFDEAKTKALAHDVVFGETYPNSCGWPAAVEKILAQLQENGEVRDEGRSTTVRTETLEATGIYRFDLTGPEYAGYAVVAANSFEEAKTKALAEEVIGGEIDLSEWETDDLAELRLAVAELAENGQVERAGHTLVAKTIA